jgi:hypothetical protein
MGRKCCEMKFPAREVKARVAKQGTLSAGKTGMFTFLMEWAVHKVCLIELYAPLSSLMQQPILHVATSSVAA